MPTRSTIAIDARKLGDTGVGRHVEGLLSGLSRAPATRSTQWRGLAPPERWRHAAEVPDGFEWVAMRSTPYSLGQHAEAYALLRRSNISLLHATHFTTPLIIPRDTRLVVTIHDAHLLDRPDLVSDGRMVPGRLLAYHLLMRLAIQRARLVTTVSETGAEDLKRLLPAVAGKLRVVPNSLDVVRFSPNVIPRPNIERDLIVFSGSLTRRKGVEVLVKCVAAAPEFFRKYRLALVGPATSRDSIGIRRLISSLAVDNLVIVPGAVTNTSALLAWYARARVVVLPSFLESFGYPILEAMALGIPCVGSDLPAIREVSAGAALLVAAGDAHSLVDAIVRAATDQRLRETLTDIGLARARAYRVEEMGTRALSVYDEALGRT